MAFKSLEDVEFVEAEDKVLGEGGFSQVRLVKLKNNKKLYALKCVGHILELDRHEKDQFSP